MSSTAHPAPPKSAFHHPLTIAWGDCDPARIVYTARIPWFALDAINGWWRAHIGSGWYEMELDRNVGTPFVHMAMDFHAPITPRHILDSHVWPSQLGTTSITFRVIGMQGGTRCFSGRFVCVFTKADAFRKSPPPEEIRKIVESHLVPDEAENGSEAKNGR